MKPSKTPEEIAQQWERAIERATEDNPYPSDTSDQNLNDAAGLRVQSGIQSGFWGISNECSDDCSSICK